ncbi:YihY/virulence factor BrkB family protein [Sphingomonas bacterium]|uniref:YihY/virulence factor BrkB family protein n=1 Tax=Sphingomonas bacterium TaxID=1895847 RepID=UPI0015763ACF|nr:YihY/virulence factor BrkB family protein [Sphingomonas bacterium]
MGGDISEADRAIRRADNPWTILRHDGWSVLKATWADAGTNNLSLIAAGTAFWGFAAIVPLLAATVLTYGLIATPTSVAANIHGLFGVLPRDAATLIGDQLTNIVKTSGNKKGWGLALALLLAVYGGTQGATALITALNVAYQERETRGFIKLYLVAFAITGAAVILALGAAASTTATAFLDSLMPWAPDIALTAIRILSYAVLGAMAVTAAGMLYRFGPDRSHARWIWLTPGSLIATLLWLAVTGAFAFYAAHLGNYSATYGSLGAVIVLQFWLWLSGFVFLLGAELNSQLERRTAKDTTTGPPAPPGERGAAVADAVGRDVPPPR